MPRRPTSRPSDFKRALRVRWESERGQAALRALLDDVRFAGGEDAHVILAGLRWPGLPDDVLDLRGVDLSGRDLAGSALRGADLSGAKLDGANLVQADLSRSNLTRASLVGADLAGATLLGCQLHGVDLTRADLSEANLRDADLRGSLLRETRLDGAYVRGLELKFARLEGVDLSRVRRDSYPRGVTTRRLPKQGSAPTLRLRPAPPPKPAPPPTAEIDAALARLLLNKGKISRLVATIDGREQVVFDGRSARRRAA